MPSLTYPAMSDHSGIGQGIKRATSDLEMDPTPSNSKRLRVDPPSETVSRRDPKKRKKKRKKAPVVTKLDGAHHTQDSSSQRLPPVSVRNQIIRFTPAERSGSKTSVEVLPHPVPAISSPASNDSDNQIDFKEQPQSGNLKGKGLMEHGNLDKPPSLIPQHPLGVVPDDRIAQLTQELVERDELLAAHRSVLNNISQALTCQICLDIMYKPYALAPCGHVACYNCLVQWFNAPPADNQPGPPAIIRKKTCPHCRTVVQDRPAEIWTIKNLAYTIGKCDLLNVPPHHRAEADADRPGDADPWDGIFRKSGHGYLPWFLADDTDPEPRRGEDVGMLDVEDGGIYRCLDCMHEIWDGMCTACGRRYPGHEGGEWSDDELGLDFASGAEEFDPEDDPGWMGLEDGEGDGHDDGLAIADWYPGLPLFGWRFGINVEDDENEEDDDEAGGLGDADYESSFIDDDDDDDDDAGIPRSPMQRQPQIYELPDDDDNDGSPSHVDVDTSEEEGESSLPRRRRTAPIIVSSGEEDDDDLDSDFAVPPIHSRSRRRRLIESDDELLDSSGRSSHS